MPDKEIQVALARIEEKIDGLSEVKADHETRLRFLEKAQWVRTGVISVLCVAVAWIAKPFFAGGA